MSRRTHLPPALVTATLHASVHHRVGYVALAFAPPDTDRPRDVFSMHATEARKFAALILAAADADAGSALDTNGFIEGVHFGGPPTEIALVQTRNTALNSHASDNWCAGPHVLSAEQTSQLRALLEQSPLILEHRFYRHGCSPERHVLETPDDLDRYLRERVRPGDALVAWRFDHTCTDERILLHAKIPDALGRAPTRGAY